MFVPIPASTAGSTYSAIEISDANNWSSINDGVSFASDSNDTSSATSMPDSTISMIPNSSTVVRDIARFQSITPKITPGATIDDATSAKNADSKKTESFTGARSSTER